MWMPFGEIQAVKNTIKKKQFSFLNKYVEKKKKDRGEIWILKGTLKYLLTKFRGCTVERNEI